MTSTWLALLPLILISALMPIEMAITITLLGSPGRVRPASSAVAGMIAVRLLQGLIFGSNSALGRARQHRERSRLGDVHHPAGGGHTAVRHSPPGSDQRRRSRRPTAEMDDGASSMTPGKAFLLGAGVILISVKLWIFTFGASASRLCR